MGDMTMRKRVVQACRQLSAKGLVGANEGNISARDGGRVYLTPSGCSKELITEQDIIVTDMDGTVLEGRLKPTSEAILHRECYRLRPDVGGVVHCHSPYASAWANAHRTVISRVSTEFMMMFGMVPLLKYGTPGTAEIASDLPGYIDKYDVFLLANHGMAAVGKTVQDACDKAVSLEMVLHTEFIRISMFGDDQASELPVDECTKLIEQGLRTRMKSRR